MPTPGDEDELPPQQNPGPAPEAETPETPDLPVMPLPADPLFAGTDADMNTNPPEQMDAQAIADGTAEPQPQGDAQPPGEADVGAAGDVPPPDSASETAIESTPTEPPAEDARVDAQEQEPPQAADTAAEDVPPAEEAQIDAGGDAEGLGEGPPAGLGDGGPTEGADPSAQPPAESDAPAATDTPDIPDGSDANAQAPSSETPAGEPAGVDAPAVPVQEGRGEPPANPPDKPQRPEAWGEPNNDVSLPQPEQQGGCTQAEAIAELRREVEELKAMLQRLPAAIAELMEL